MSIASKLYACFCLTRCRAQTQVANFCFTNLLLQQQQPQLGVVVSAMAAVQPVKTAQKFLPMCLRILLVSPSDTPTPRTPKSARDPHVSPGHTSPASNNARASAAACAPMEGEGSATSGGYRLALLSEMELVYYLNLMRYVLDNAGDAAMPYKDKIMALVDLALVVEERPGVVSLQVFKAANKLVRALLHSLVTCRPKEHRSLSPSTWNDPEWQKKHYVSWGHVIDISQAEISWHIPSEEGLKWAAHLAARYIRKPLALLQGYTNSTSHALDVGEPRFAQALGAHKTDSDSVDKMDADGGGSGRKTLGPQSPCTSSPSAGGRAPVNNDSMVVDGDGGNAQPVKGSSSRSSTISGKRPIDLEVHVADRSCDPPLPRSSAIRRKTGGASATEARFAVLQLRYVLEGMVAAMPGWDSHDDAATLAADGAGDQDDQGVEDDDGMPGEEVYSSGTYELPLSSIDLPQVLNGSKCGERGACDLLPSRIAPIIRDLVQIALKQHSQDSKMLKALSKCLDVCMNGVDTLQKYARRLRLRYTIMKARNRESAADGNRKLLPRYMLVVKVHHQYLSRVMLRLRKLHSTPLISSMLPCVNALSVNEHSGVRSRGQLALLSFCRRYKGSCASALPKLISILADKDVEAPGHEQRICGACVLLQTRYFQNRILRDWRMVEHFLVTLCNSHHNDKESVLDALDGLFATFLSFWYQISLDMPGYIAWKGGVASWGRAEVPFENYGRMLELVVGILKTSPHIHWRFKLMVIDAVTVMIRDDVQSPVSVWECIFDGMVSENSHIREACVPALGSALELIQDRQQSKEDADGSQARFPDKTACHCEFAHSKVATVLLSERLWTCCVCAWGRRGVHSSARVCVCASVRGCARACCVCACVRGRMCLRGCMCVCVCVRACVCGCLSGRACVFVFVYFVSVAE